MAAAKKDKPVRHAWLDLITTDGPFLSRPALAETFDDQWPPKVDPAVRKAIGPTKTIGGDGKAGWPDDPHADVDRFLTDVLGYTPGKTLDTTRCKITHKHYMSSTVTIHGVAHPKKRPEDPRMVVLSAADFAATPDRFDPTLPTATGGAWKPTPVQRATLAARETGCPLALVTDGRRHLIVWTGAQMVGWGFIDAADYRYDSRLADATVALLHHNRVNTLTDNTLDDLLRISQDKQASLTDTLGIQVRRAAEAIVNAISRANRSNPALLDSVDAHQVYSGVVTVLMRTVFLLNAEEKDLIGDDGMWQADYAISSLLDQLDDDHARNPGLLSQRHGAWARILAASRVVHDGVDHAQMNVYGYGGGLFDPTRHPFLEGITADGEQLDIGIVDDATIRHVLDLLQRLKGDRISYRTLTVEQVGQVYEHLLDHSARTVPDGDVVLGLIGPKGMEPEVALSDLDANKAKLANWLADTIDHSSGTLAAKKARWAKRLANPDVDERVQATINQACNNQPDILDAVRPYENVLDVDARGVAKVFLPGDVYVTETSIRRDSGTSYTSPAFASEIAKHTLRHLVYAVDLPGDDDPDEGLKTPEEILDLKVCDPAVGSGAIIVAAVRYLADRLVASRNEHGTPATASAAANVAETDQEIQAARDIVANCIYAVDRDPMAVEMTKLSLWLITMAKNKPFTFIDHAIRSGDSLLGITSLDQLRGFHLDDNRLVENAVDSGNPLEFHGYHEMIDAKIAKALELRAQVRAGDVVHPDEAAKRAAISARADRELADLRIVADAITATCYTHAASRQSRTDDALRGNVLNHAMNIEANRDALAAIAQHRPKDATGHFRFFHWAIEYPEVLAAGGFDAMVGNPPFQGGKKIKGASGASYREHIIRYAAGGDAGSADLVSYFFRRASALALGFGFIATNTVAQGDSRRVALKPITRGEVGHIPRAISSEAWPGRDAVYVAKIWWQRGDAGETAVLDGRTVPGIESDLWPTGDVAGDPLALPKQGGATAGQYVLGEGYVLDEETAGGLLKDPVNHDVIAKYISGSDINKSPTHDSDRWVINFRDWPLSKAQTYPDVYDYALEFIKPQRDQVSRKQYSERWWRYAEYRPNLVARLSGLDRTIVAAQVSSRVMPALVPTTQVFSHKVIVFPWNDEALLGLLSSTVHRVWVDRYTSTMKSDVSYSPTDCFDTFPMPGTLAVSDDPESDRLSAPDAQHIDRIRTHMAALNVWRARQMVELGDGITKVYGRYHDEDATDNVTTELRERHVELDRLVTEAYGWDDLDLGHGFHQTRYGTFFTVSTEARFELLMRLLELNFVQYAEQTGKDLEQVKKEAQSA